MKTMEKSGGGRITHTHTHTHSPKNPTNHAYQLRPEQLCNYCVD